MMKVAILIDHSLPIGIAANCAAVLGVSLGANIPEIVGPPVSDRTGRVHPGITSVPIPVLAASAETLRGVAEAAALDSTVRAIAFNHIAQSCVSYDDYQARLADAESPRFLGVLVIGPPKAVARLTGSLPLLR